MEITNQELTIKYTAKLKEDQAKRASEWLTKSLGWPIPVSDCLGSTCKELLDNLLTDGQQKAYGKSFIKHVWKLEA